MTAGFTIGHDFAPEPERTLKLSIGYDFGLRFYHNNGDEGVVHVISVVGTPPESTGIAAAGEYPTRTTVTAARHHAAPSFLFNGPLGASADLGLKVNLDTEWDVTEYRYPDGEIKRANFALASEFDVGVSVHVIPDHLSVHGGVAISLYPIALITETDTTGGVDTQTTDTALSMPSTKVAAGFTINFTANTRVEMILLTSGLGLDVSKFTLFASTRF